MKVFIIGLRRSGTTIFWQALRQDSRFVCYEEPFNPLLRELPAENAKGTWDEFIQLFNENSVRFRSMFAPIRPEEELCSQLNSEQQEYLRWLLKTGQHVICKLTRCNFKVRALHDLDPQSVLIHLYRAPASVATSHLLPSGGTERWRRRIANIVRRKTFWWRSGWYNNWHFEDIIDGSSNSPFISSLLKIGLDPEEVTSLPAVGKLLAYWRVAFERVQADGRKLFGHRFVSISFEKFCQNPQQTIDRTYQLLALPKVPFNMSLIRPSRHPFYPDHPNWQRYYKLLRLPDSAFRQFHDGHPKG